MLWTTMLLIPPLSLLYDLTIGERPLAIHPVMAYGRVITFYDKHLELGLGRFRLRAYGLALILSLAFVAVMPILALKGLGILMGDQVASLIISVPICVFILKASFSLNHMIKEARAVKGLVDGHDLEGARKKVSHIVSRDTSDLSFEEIISADVECISESIADSIVSPLFYFMCFGLYGCQIYRAVNSADSRVGYRTERYMDFGYVPAKLDDLLNFVPSRIAVILTLISGSILGHDARRGWRSYRKYGGVTESPNAGQTMSVYAGMLGIQLHKKGHYTIGDPTYALGVGHIEQAIRIYALSTAIMMFFAMASILIGLPIIFL
ncbi:MAG: cobalamin biosynthesis protein [Candidatus Methanofastidiosa archaeon]|nr:cobalamin biosynthesis protein [Candidatus Methanofastidiosa archaeon]